MKKIKVLSRNVLLIMILLIPGLVKAQEEKKMQVSAGADLYSSYLWRGTRYGTGPAIQPFVSLSAGFFSAGAWGSFDFSGYRETDLWFSFDLPAGFSIGMTDYYFPDLDYLDYSEDTGSHAFEINAGYSKGGLALSAGYIINKAGSAGAAGGDKYIEAKYSFSSLYILTGAGDGWHVQSAETGFRHFTICNIGIGLVKELTVTESFSVPVNGQIVFNPDRNTMYAVVGFTF